MVLLSIFLSGAPGNLGRESCAAGRKKLVKQVDLLLVARLVFQLLGSSHIYEHLCINFLN